MNDGLNLHRQCEHVEAAVAFDEDMPEHVPLRFKLVDATASNH
jgi:hypothetical protein